MPFQNLNVCVVTCQTLSENGKSKQYLDIKDGICYGLDLEVILNSQRSLKSYEVSAELKKVFYLHA
jgi:hypothetical protein